MQPLYEITHHPVDLSRHGVNPYGQPLYRVVWADSRKSKVLFRGKTHILPRYHDEETTAGHWVLEKWASGETILGMNREQYAGLLASMGSAAAEEFPEQGDYELSYVFQSEVDEVFLHKQLDMHEFRIAHRSKADALAEVNADEDKKEQQQEASFDAMYDAAREETQCL